MTTVPYIQLLAQGGGTLILDGFMQQMYISANWYDDIIMHSRLSIFTECQIVNNTVTGAGGGIYIHTEVEYTYNITSQPTEVTHCQLANNRALTGNGGAIIYMGHVARERVMILGSTSLSIITLSVC